MSYIVKPYDGEGGDSLATMETSFGPFITLNEAREFCHKKIEGDFGSFDGPFSEAEEEEGLLECWHESDQEGCGGYAIYEIMAD